MASAQALDPRPLAGEPLALDLLNTQWLAAGARVDLLATTDGIMAWFTATGVQAQTVPGTRRALLQAREAIREIVSGNGAAAAAARDRLNAVLAHGRLRLSIGPMGTAEQAMEVDDPAWRPAVLAAASLLQLLKQAPDRIRQCQHEACVLWFFDTTRNGTRRWCSMAVCGNRAKAMRHYNRAREQPADR